MHTAIGRCLRQTGNMTRRPDIKDGPDNDYWDHVDWIIDKAAEKGIYIGLLPTWGDKLDKKWGVGPEIFDVNNAKVYGVWIANRYKDKPNIIWINGGDRPGGGKNFAVWNAIAEAIKSADKNHLMTFHPMGGNSSSEWFHKKDWLNFNMFQSGHGKRDFSNYRMIMRDYNLQPAKPCLDGEPRYEDHPVNWDVNQGWFDNNDVRQAVYWSVFAGGCGVTYGCHDIWQFLDKARTPYPLQEITGTTRSIYLGVRMMYSPADGIEADAVRVPEASLIIEGQTAGLTILRRHAEMIMRLFTAPMESRSR